MCTPVIYTIINPLHGPSLTDQLLEEQTHAKANQEEVALTKSESHLYK